MNELAAAAARFLQDLLPKMVGSVRPWSGERALPHYLSGVFDLAEIDLLGEPVLLALVVSQPQPLPSSRLRAHLRTLADRVGLKVILVLPGLSSYVRRQLIESRVDFIVPGSQLFAPSFLMSLRERDSAAPLPVEAGEHLSHPAQAILIAALLRPEPKEGGAAGSVPWSPGDLAREAGYTRMTASRASRELVSAGLVSAERVGRETALRFLLPRRDVWEAALPRLRSPVVRTTYASKGDLAMLPADECRAAGETGMAALTEIAAPARTVCAVPRDYFRRHGEPEWVPEPGEGYADVQRWAYTTGLQGSGNVADPLSLFLSLQGQGDPRLDGALDDLIDGVFR